MTRISNPKNRVRIINNFREKVWLKGLKKKINPARNMIKRKTQTTLASYRKPIQNTFKKCVSPGGAKTRWKTIRNNDNSSRKKRPVTNNQRINREWIILIMYMASKEGLIFSLAVKGRKVKKIVEYPDWPSSISSSDLLSSVINLLSKWRLSYCWF